MAKIFNKLTFKKLPYGKIVATNGKVSFMKLADEIPFVPPPPHKVITETFDLRYLGLRKGTYAIIAKSEALQYGFNDSDPSEPYIYTVE